MNLDSLLPNLGEWLRGTGPESDVVVSTRIRLARNLVNYPFTNRASAHQKGETAARSREAFCASLASATLACEPCACRSRSTCYTWIGGCSDLLQLSVTVITLSPAACPELGSYPSSGSQTTRIGMSAVSRCWRPSSSGS